MKKIAPVLVALAASVSMSGCVKADNPPKLDKDVIAMGRYTFKLPAGYTLFKQDNTRVMMTSKDGYPLTVALGTAKDKVDLGKWCDEIIPQLKTNYGPNPNIKKDMVTYRNTPSCVLASHGTNKVKNIPYSLYTSMTKLKNGDYVGIMGGHPNGNDNFTIEKTLRETLIEDVK